MVESEVFVVFHTSYWLMRVKHDRSMAFFSQWNTPIADYQSISRRYMTEILPIRRKTLYNQSINLIKINPFISLSIFLSFVKGSNATLFERRSGDLMTCYWQTNPKISCKCFGAVGNRMLLSVLTTTIRYTRFHWLIYKLKRWWQEVTRTCHKLGCIRSFQQRQK